MESYASDINYYRKHAVFIPTKVRLICNGCRYYI